MVRAIQIHLLIDLDDGFFSFPSFQTGSTTVLYRQCREILEEKGLGDYGLAGMDFQGVDVPMNNQNIPNRPLTDFIEAGMVVKVKFKSRRILEIEQAIRDFENECDEW